MHWRTIKSYFIHFRSWRRILALGLQRKMETMKFHLALYKVTCTALTTHSQQDFSEWGSELVSHSAKHQPHKASLANLVSQDAQSPPPPPLEKLDTKLKPKGKLGNLSKELRDGNKGHNMQFAEEVCQSPSG